MSSSAATKKFEVFGDYVLLKSLAAGGMAEVFLARPAKPGANGRVLVIKRILREIATDPIFIKMFRSEIQTILGFNNSHTIQLHDCGEVDYQPYIAMEYIEGKSLREITMKFAEKGEPIPVPTVLGLIAQAASGLDYAHQFQNLATGETVHAVHRDISPHNLIVSYSGNLKVIDFGIAKAKNGIAEKTRAGQIKGKCGYLSPEQLAEEELDGRSDIFSLGIVAWELLTSQKLFQKNGDTELQIIKRIENCELHITAPSTLNPEISPEVDAVILRALQKDPDLRYPSAAAFQAALRVVMLKQYPHYAYGDTAQIMHALFEADMTLERMELRELNDAAQQVLTAELDAKTSFVETAPVTKQGGIASFFRGFKSNAKHLPDLQDVRITKLEAMLKQKAGFKHVALFVFYLISIVSIKLDEKYSLLDRFFLPAQAEIVASNEKVHHFQSQLKTRYTEEAANGMAAVSPEASPAVILRDSDSPDTTIVMPMERTEPEVAPRPAPARVVRAIAPRPVQAVRPQARPAAKTGRQIATRNTLRAPVKQKLQATSKGARAPLKAKNTIRN
jgi:serine/threonine protein kinase